MLVFNSNWTAAVFLSTLLAVVSSGRADDQAAVTASLPTATVHAGDQTTLTITTAVADGYHLQSHTPKDLENDIAFVVTPTNDPSVTFGSIVYPPGEDQTFGAAVGASITVNCYVGTFKTTIPVTISPDAQEGPLTIRGTVQYQACTDLSCSPPPNPLPKFEVNLTVVPKASALVAATTVATTAPTAAPPPAPHRPRKSESTILGIDLKKSGLLAALPIGFVVGIIFNLMPCVLPVVPLKIMGFYEASQHNRAKSLGLGLAFSVGMVASFLALGLLIFPLHVIDWGGLFQKAWFVAAIVVVMSLMAAGTYGLFSVALPGNLYNFTPRHDTVSGNVGFGILTAALSTPCTFGMFAGLLAWSITQPKWMGVVVMGSVGVGMAAPYLILSGFPEMARRFPRTGPWAEVVKQFMAFLLLAAAVFFAQPFFAKVNAIHANWWLVFAVIVAGAVFLVVRGVQLHKSPVALWVTGLIATLIVVPSAYFAHRLTIEPYQWTPYSDKALADALASGRPVVVDFTASYCTNCHWIEANALNAGSVVREVHDQKAVMLKADIEQSEPLRKLKMLEPSTAIPLTAVYQPGVADPELLFGLYSDQDLLELMNTR